MCVDVSFVLVCLVFILFGVFWTSQICGLRSVTKEFGKFFIVNSNNSLAPFAICFYFSTFIMIIEMISQFLDILFSFIFIFYSFSSLHFNSGSSVDIFFNSLILSSTVSSLLMRLSKIVFMLLQCLLFLAFFLWLKFQIFHLFTCCLLHVVYFSLKS